jgi:PTH1 family peptidyl-tRNA hydrolase
VKKYLIVGLGNVGPKYQETRHNIGFKCVEALAAKHGATFEANRFGDLASFKFRGRPVILLKPDTYMNLSGNAIQFWMKKEGIQADNLLVITDDLNLDFGTIRLKGKGSDGGHNGLKHIQQILGHTKYPRIRFGISDSFEKGRQVDYVLGEWTEKEKIFLKDLILKVCKGVEMFMQKSPVEAMNYLNTKVKPSPADPEDSVG